MGNDSRKRRRREGIIAEDARDVREERVRRKKGLPKSESEEAGGGESTTWAADPSRENWAFSRRPARRDASEAASAASFSSARPPALAVVLQHALPDQRPRRPVNECGTQSRPSGPSARLASRSLPSLP
jgi:hypothetical protein